MPLRFRLLISALIGLAVFAISCEAGHQQFCSAVGVPSQGLALYEIGKVVEAVEAYRQENHLLPGALNAIRWTGGQVGANGAPLDVWRRPLHYSTDGTHYRIASYGRDGVPGGAGFDYDLSSDDLPKSRAPGTSPNLAPPTPPRAMPTLWQFATDRPHYLHGSGRMMFLMGILAGVVAFALSMREAGRPISDGGASLSRWLRLVVVVLATLFIAVIYVIPLHVPSGH